MFKIDAEYTFTEEVKLNVTQDGKNPTFDCTFKALEDADVKKFDERTVDGQKEFLRAVVTDFSGLLGDDDEPMPFSSELLEKVIARAYVRAPMLMAYSLGLNSARLGN